MRKPTIGSIQRVLAACAAALALAAPAAQASFLEGEALDTMANVVSWFAITVGSLPSITATHEFVVPRSIPITLPIGFSGSK